MDLHAHEPEIRIPSEDAASFLAEMIAEHRPRTVVELGVASRVSAAMLHALDQLPDIHGGRLLYSCDVRPGVDRNNVEGTTAARQGVHQATRVRWRTECGVHPRRLAEALPRYCVELSFMDANHAHPRPLLDLLHLTAVAKPGSWVVLQDVDRLVRYARRRANGPRCLFEAWPFNKVKGQGGRGVSMGALQLPFDFSDLVPLSLALLSRPWEQVPTYQDVDLPSAFAEVHEHLRFQIAPVECFSVIE